MPGKSWNIDWRFDKHAVCFNCGKDAVQAIEMLPVATTVTCTNCGAERIYNIHGTFATNCTLETPDQKCKYDVWQFTKQARCPNCGSESEHKVTMDEYKVSAVCPVCCYTHLYRFNVFTRGRLTR
jgi:transcription elongation factor Elf1